jgi:class 3 adenylate cyclase
MAGTLERSVIQKLSNNYPWAGIFREQRSRNHFGYSGMGDNLNMASRLEGAAKRDGITAFMSEETMRQAERGIIGLALGHAYAVFNAVDETTPVELETADDRCMAFRLFKAIYTDKISPINAV